jgi:glycosyltransferase involved in cell wall biosynthesis
MKILQVHNYYQHPGGEDYVFEAESRLLEARGHVVLRYTDHNERIGRWSSAAAGASAVWNQGSFRRIRRLVRREDPDVVHFHNTFPLISPSALHAARMNGTAIVHTLHNYRLLCPMGRFFRDGRPCQDCLGRAAPWPAVAHGCYRDSRLATAAVAGMLVTHGAIGTWRRKADVFVALTEFARRKFIEGGLPAERIVVKPNFVTPDPGVGEGEGSYALFVGRLSPEKGVDVLLDAFRRAGGAVPLVVVGDGPLAPQVAEMAASNGNLRWLGWRPRAEVHALLREARFLVFPSVWFETFGLGIVESFAAGRPVLASALGAPAEIVEPGRTGWLVPPGDAAVLAAALEAAWSDPTAASVMGRTARREYESSYTEDRGYEELMTIYDTARARAARRGGKG